MKNRTNGGRDAKSMAADEKLKREVGARIGMRREERGLLQKQLAAKSGIPKSMVCAYECGRYMMGIDVLKRFAEALGVSADWLLGIERGR